MKNKFRVRTIELLCNLLEITGVLLVLFMTLAFQFILQELPCPLCLFQRVGMFCVALGFLMNMRFGLRPSHYAMIILGALYTSFVALRQVALHILPGAPGFGAPFLGLHLYTWSFIVSIIIIVVTTLMMGVDRQYLPLHAKHSRYRWLVHSLFAITVLLILFNIYT
ncbi:MAG TPA: disulfide bond formation protein B, partial [Gammaproteobacteria bacterium]|nr:disulfide bond formation protein B [Gammaproteobacteria bacterium]